MGPLSQQEAFQPMLEKVRDALQLVFDARDFTWRNNFTLEGCILDLAALLLVMCLNVNGRPYNVAGILSTIYSRHSAALGTAAAEAYAMTSGAIELPAQLPADLVKRHE